MLDRLRYAIGAAIALAVSFAFAYQGRPHWAGEGLAVLFGMGAGALARKAVEEWGRRPDPLRGMTAEQSARYLDAAARIAAFASTPTPADWERVRARAKEEAGRVRGG